ncbi:MAG: acyltransferase [Chitinophagaceae bacterium]|nr:acyltransferase [Chitinophagaceae bacterium]
MSNRLLSSIKSKRKRILMERRAILKGSNYVLGLLSGVTLIDGSKREDIIVGDNLCFYGNLTSQNGGKIKIGDYCRIGLHTQINSVESIEVGNYVTMADYIVVTDNNNHPINPDFRKFMRMKMDKSGTNLWKHSDHRPVIIEDNVWIGTRVRIHKGVTIGENSIVAACSIVTKDIPPNCIAAGNPAIVVKENIERVPPPNSCASFNNENRWASKL